MKCASTHRANRSLIDDKPSKMGTHKCKPDPVTSGIRCLLQTEFAQTQTTTELEPYLGQRGNNNGA
jgi:hypothetical protein